MQLPQKTWLEWAVFGISVVLVGGVLGFLAYDALTSGAEPPIVEVQLGAPQPGASSYVVPVTVINHGDNTAEGVQIEVVLDRADGPDETGQFEIAFLPRGSSGEGWVTFSADPGSGQLRARVRGYEKP